MRKQAVGSLHYMLISVDIKPGNELLQKMPVGLVALMGRKQVVIGNV